MYNRRKFLQNSGALALGGLLLSGNSKAFFHGSKAHAVGLQLFTFFNEIDNDVEGTLKKIAAIGYTEIESAFSKKGGYYGMKPKEFAAYLTSIGLGWKSHHVLGAPFKMPPGAKMPTDANGNPIKIPPMRNLADNMQELVDEAAEGGVEFLVCANTPINTLSDINASIEVLNKTDEACKKAGIGFAYHNHDAEFHTIEGQVPYEMFLSQTKMQMELDLAWATKGGKDPVELFKQHPGRFPLWHVKDVDATFENILPVGSGTINYKRIFDAAATAGMKHFFVEHDMPKDAMASITASYEYLTKKLGV
ncbi:sugar phosphate isomerase/epimerase [Panacibacter sp. DH6]|uniref:Sugar phosphate isomerase/epimerase n=1 Tax=Panacibacter microcysteis TaxID=2793269 RepID=A0A931E3V2_9BACT|nr:sugar phosphate isomerase/epimerase [Panacibacter microcysteis]MBG9374795.1 sugar phosphate isomerase/epimerase [Panacibacter microcysteis]